MKLLIFLTVICMVLIGCQGQIKNLGIKTRYPPPSSGNIILDSTTQQNYIYNQQQQYAINQQQPNNYNQYNGNFKPAEYYQGSTVVTPVYRPQPVILDATAEFINKTRSTMASGICYKEVPTASLVPGANFVPVGNGTQPDMSKIQVCCEGYERNPHAFHRCDPICADGCPNGICTAPNTCVCIPGHLRNEEGKCVTTCPIGCDNGVCGDYNECKCKPGYVLEPVFQKYCVPLCEPSCQFGKCIAPNKCECQEGYRLTATGICEPRCDNCENGKCTAPGICSCYGGYIKIGAICEPICTRGCQNGICTAPETCSCNQGFELDPSGTRCIPHCDFPCINGFCTSHNQCVCNIGFKAHEGQSNLCKPHCPLGCPNGYCSGPNLCSCNPGFIKTGIKGHQSCTPV